jgi:hypothetical protein
MSTTPPPPPQSPSSHPELQYEDSQRFRDYVHSIDFGDDDSFDEHMFERPTEGPQPELPRVVLPTELQRRARDFAPLRGTGGGKDKGKGKVDGQHERKKAHAEHEEVPVDSVRQSPNSDTAKAKGHMTEVVGHGEDAHSGRSSEDGAWSIASESEDDEDCIAVVPRKHGACKEEQEKVVQ